jgi:heme A synthase
VRFPDLDRAARDYIESFADDRLDGQTLLFAIWLYLAFAIASCALLLRRAASSPARVAGAAALAALLFQAGLFFGVGLTQYRFEFPAVALSMLAAIVAVQLALSRHRSGAERLA